MKQLIAKIFHQNTVLVLQVQGKIDQYLVNKLSHQLENQNSGSLVALALVINSQGGCQYQVEALSKKVMKYASVPIYTFATEQALGNAYQLLSLGNKSFAQNSSKIGGLSFQGNSLKFGNCLRDYGINVSYFSSSSNQNHQYLFSTQIHECNQGQLQYMNKFLENKSNYLAKQFMKPLKISKEALQNVYLGQEAKQLGLVDEIGTFEKTLIDRFPKAKIIPTGVEGKLSEYEKWFNLFIKVSQSSKNGSILGGFLGLVLLFGLKVMIKWGFIIYVWRQSRKLKNNDAKQ